MVGSGAIAFGEKIDVCVPTGNFGNIFAGYIAKLMGLPIEKLICASNVNNVLTDFLENGTYDKNRSFYSTISPSMDILISSNLERLLFTVSGQRKTAEYMKSLAENGKYTVDADVFEEIKRSFIGIYTNDDETRKTISYTFKRKNYLIDTHTSVAMKAATEYISTHEAERKVLVVSTASPYKFAKDVYPSLSSEKNPSDTEAPSVLSDLTGTEIPAPLSALCEKTILHPDTIGKEDMD